MSLASALAQPALRIGSALLRGPALAMMARSVGIILCAGLLAATYQLAGDETRAILNNLRLRSQYRRARHENILIALLGSTLAADLQDQLLRSRDSFQACMTLLADPQLAPESRTLIRQAIQQVCNGITAA